jgi:hypothetical protein
MQFYGSRATPGMVAIAKPYDEHVATTGNGSMFGFPAASKEAVDAAHAALWPPGRPATARLARGRRPSTGPISAISTATRSAFSTWVERARFAAPARTTPGRRPPWPSG